jgi:hypothetical protein
MSKFLSANAIASFDTRVKTAYELGSKLRSTVTLADNVVGSTHRFPKMGRGLATKRVPQTDVVPMNIAHTNATATLEDWNAPEYTDIFDKQKVNYSEQDKLAKIIANAIGRREDQLILDALDAAATVNTVGTDVGGTGTGLNTAKIRRAARLLNDKGVPQGRGERTLVISAEGLEQLLGDPDATTIDKNAIKTLVDGEISYWLGFEIIVMETRSEGGLPKTGNLRTSFAYAKDSIGLAVGINFRTEVNYIPQKTSWLANGIFSGGAVGIDADGMVDITTTEA